MTHGSHEPKPAASARQTPTTLIDCGSAVEGIKDEPTTEIL